MDMATTTDRKDEAMKTIEAIYVDDNGRCTCEEHAGAYLRTQIELKPTGWLYATPIGTWEKFTADDIRTFGEDIDCDVCKGCS